MLTTLTRLTVAFGAGQMYAAERRRNPKWKFRPKEEEICISISIPAGESAIHSKARWNF